MMTEIDRSKTQVKKSGCQFEPFEVPRKGKRLSDLKLSGDLELIRVERNGEQRLLVVREMAYHHVAQGELSGEPFLANF